MSNKKEAQLIIIEAFMLGTDVFFSVSAALPPLSNMCSSDRSGRGPECVCVCVMWATWEAQLRNSLTEASNMK